MKIYKNQKGYILILVVVVMAVIFIMTALIYNLLTNEIRNNIVLEQRETTTYLAQSGIEHGLNLIEMNIDPLVAPTSGFTLFTEGNFVGKYRILELSKTSVKSIGTLYSNGIIVEEITVTASIDDEGNVTYQ